jgi:propanol-preferring alcohol dehydrogenase
LPEEDVIPKGKDVAEFVQEKGLVVDTVVDFVGKEETFQAGQKAGMLQAGIGSEGEDGY